MAKTKLVIKHDLSKLMAEEVTQYLRDVSEFIGLDPDLNALDVIWMVNESGPGQSLVVYARRGTAEILRNRLGIEIVSLTNQEIRGSIVFTATGKNKEGRQEVATGSKDISKVNGKQLDDAIMTASTRALRRLTMQFTSLGILDESEVTAMASPLHAAANAQPIGAPVVFPPPQVVLNNAPGKDVTKEVLANAEAGLPPLPIEIRDSRIPNAEPFVGQQDQINAAMAQVAAKQAATEEPKVPVSPSVAPVSTNTEAVTEAAKPKRARKAKNSVSLEGPEPEVVSNSPAAPAVAVSVPAPVSAVVETAPASETPVPVPVTSVPNQGTEFPGKPSEAQMAEYRKKVSTYTSELPSSENMGSVPKMRAFITKMSGTAPQFMTVDQWQDQLAWFESFVEKNKIKGLVTYINDVLGVK